MTKRASMISYPFSAIVGQEKMKSALMAAVVHPAIGGVLIRGHRGTAKSTAVRGLANLLPRIRAVRNCPFRCDPDRPEDLCDRCFKRWEAGEPLDVTEQPVPLVNLPLGTTEDRLLGSLDLESALTRGEQRFVPGLLARANRGLLYVDEVNLLSDHLVDLLLDTSALGVHFVEREGISFRHPSRFVLIGTMNPEEGDLRPQLLDRFGLCVDVTGTPEIEHRVEIARRRMAFDADPEGFAERWKPQEERLAQRIVRARKHLHKVQVPEDMLELAVRFSSSFDTEGHRSELTIVRTAMALCALQGLDRVTPKELVQAAELALPHRIRKHGLRHGTLDPAKLREMLEENTPDPAVSERGPALSEKKKMSIL